MATKTHNRGTHNEARQPRPRILARRLQAHSDAVVGELLEQDAASERSHKVPERGHNWPCPLTLHRRVHETLSKLFVPQTMRTASDPGALPQDLPKMCDRTLASLIFINPR